VPSEFCVSEKLLFLLQLSVRSVHTSHSVMYVEDSVCVFFRRVSKIAKRDYYFLHVRPSVYLHGTARLHWTDFGEILYLGFYRKSVVRIQVSLKSDKNNGHFT
jgi:hypothetical protein